MVSSVLYSTGSQPYCVRYIAESQGSSRASRLDYPFGATVGKAAHCAAAGRRLQRDCEAENPQIGAAEPFLGSFTFNDRETSRAPGRVDQGTAQRPGA